MINQDDLLKVPEGQITEEGLRTNLRVAVQYIGAWLKGLGCVPLYNLMEDAATAEISRSQVWQWIYHKATLQDGRIVTAQLVQTLLQQEVSKLEGDLTLASHILIELSTSEQFINFLTEVAYQHID